MALVDQLKQRHKSLLEEKDQLLAGQDLLQKQLSELTTNKAHQNEQTVSEHAEKLRGKDLVIDQLQQEVKRVEQHARQQLEKEGYFKRQLE